MAAHYTKKAARKRLAGEAMALITMGRTEYKAGPNMSHLPTPVGQKRPKRPIISAVFSRA
jgi:hypothetical protein